MSILSNQAQDVFQIAGDGHIRVRHRLSFPTWRLRRGRFGRVAQFAKKVLSYVFGEESPGDGLVLNRRRNAKDLHTEHRELAVVLEDNCVQEIFWFDVRRAAFPRRPESHKDHPPRSLGVSLEHSPTCQPTSLAISDNCRTVPNSGARGVYFSSILTGRPTRAGPALRSARLSTLIVEYRFRLQVWANGGVAGQRSVAFEPGAISKPHRDFRTTTCHHRG